VLLKKKYWESNGKSKYGDLKDLVSAGLLDSALVDGRDNGYVFAVTQIENGDYYATAKPEVYGSSSYWGTGGISIFLSSTDGVRVVYNEGKAPSPRDFPTAR
jgi:hypothetical protein